VWIRTPHGQDRAPLGDETGDKADEAFTSLAHIFKDLMQLRMVVPNQHNFVTLPP
jgi:hypothetical protein